MSVSIQEEETIISEIKYYRSFLYELCDKMDTRDSILKNELSNQECTVSSHYADKVYENILEARMHLGNFLNHGIRKESPYKKHSINRLQNYSEYIPDQKDTEDVYTFYIRKNEPLASVCDRMREIIDELICLLNSLIGNDEYDYLFLRQSVVNLSTAKKYLGRIIKKCNE